MSENVQNLSQKIANALEFGSDVEIPSYITQNLNKDLREYQITALKHFYLQRKNPQTNHLMFNMATGSGKTLIMAALMLECYKQGYRNFIFFVNSTAILEKTKANFCDERSEKYLFKDKININAQSVEINAVSNLAECKEGAINVYFSTVQGLYSLFTNERENAFTLEDLKGRKFAFLADEAHHLNANTKKQSEEDKKSGWEGVINEAFKSCEENLLLEFSATIPNERAVKEKYKDKIIYEYALKEFHDDKFSKRIYLLKYNGMEIEERFLGSMLLNIYRMLLAQVNGVFLKPVILYKSKTINESNANEKAFLDFVARLESKKVQEFIQNYANLSKSDDESVLFSEAKEFFERQNITSEEILAMIKEFFNNSFIINANNEENQQILLNSLESKKNEIRAIFAVDKLNEGWDVLNLFDIVRLNKGAINDTTKEAQLIGRGARYYPFEYGDLSESKFKRKFDETQTPLKALEILTYHAASENEFITRLNKELVNIGLKQPKQKSIKLRVKEEIKQSEFYKEAHFATNSRKKVSSTQMLFSEEVVKKIISESNDMQIPLFNAKGVVQDDLMKNEDKEEFSRAYKSKNLKDFPRQVILKAMNILHKNYNFTELSKRFDIKSKNEFIDKYLNFSVKLHPRQGLEGNQTLLQIAHFALEALSENISKHLDAYMVGDWSVKPLNIIGDKEIVRDLDIKVENLGNYEWFYFDSFVGTSEERAFLDFIEEKKELINEHFQAWLVVRNERFSELAIYDCRKRLENGEENDKYGERFEPDFYFLGKRVGEQYLTIQCLIEPKGEKWQDDDKWKEGFLADLFDKKMVVEKLNLKVKVQGMPFFNQNNNEKFKEKFELFIKENGVSGI